MRVQRSKSARLLATCLLAFAIGLFASGTAVAQSYVPTAPPTIASDGSLVSFSGLTPGDSVTATFALSNGAVSTVLGSVDQSGNVIFSVPLNAIGVTVSSTIGSQTSISFPISGPSPAPAATPVPTAVPAPTTAPAPTAVPAAAAASPTQAPVQSQAAAPAQAASGGLGDAPDELAFAEGGASALATTGSGTATPVAIGSSLIILGIAALFVSGRKHSSLDLPKS